MWFFMRSLKHRNSGDRFEMVKKLGEGGFGAVYQLRVTCSRAAPVACLPMNSMNLSDGFEIFVLPWKSIGKNCPHCLLLQRSHQL